ncbi:iron ABC transporter permease [Aeromicrobium sp. 50.2.37]|uniref:ABC transporter permease n=1 Tax=Aeromicrobium sp. 50.2.37 TaxID=2969305 RepID=UPI00214F8560|nr:iron ABC transporter permease [Aeromicrobium sp. 50.2.37]MCR4513060.1 iron ABC transporter permease [Aeromicrobium sp. 50.2.37]
MASTLVDAPAAPSPAPRSDTSAPRTRAGFLRRWLGSGLLIAVLAFLILVPAGFVLLASMTGSVPRPGNISLSPTLGNFGVLGVPEVRQAFVNSMVMAIAATLLAGLIGGGLAFLAARTDIRIPSFVYLVGLMPMFLPSYVGALAWSMLGSPNAGLLNIGLRDVGLPAFVNMYSMPGLVLVFAMYYAPYTFLMVHAALSLMSPDLEEAAQIHGSSTRTMLRRISFPLALPAVLGSGILTFTLIFENFPVAQVLGTPGGVDTLPTFIFRLLNATPSRGNESAAIAIVLVAVVLVATALQNRVIAKRSFTTVTGKGVKNKKIALGKWRTPALVAVLGFFTLSIVLPLLALVVTAGRATPYMTSIGDLFQPGAFDLSILGTVLQSEGFLEATGNSVVVSIVAATAGTVLAFVCGYTVYRTTVSGRRLVEGISMVPLAIPAVVLGMGLLWTWLVMPIPLYGTLAVMAIAFIAVQSPQGFRGIASSILQTDRDLEDSAVMLGASRTRAILAVTVPLMKVGLLSTFVLLLMLSMRELTVPLFLYTTDTKILSIAIYDAFENGGALRGAAAMSLLYCLIMFVLSYIPRRLANR